ncbi:TPA: RNA polymerase sigma factor [Candidatus Gracilibacteria bacterium]|nr:RNA polymerase sigma factor [Candidatus Gracilibacteria bacterium]HIQ57478.1 RNA polymerase sigma factor [Candidatus Gracilibacteria bacterium]
MTKEEIQTLAEKSKENDLNAFTLLVKHFEVILLRYIFRLSDISQAEAEEILQETFLHAWRYLKEYNESFAFSTWIYRIAHQKTISYHRKEISRGKEHKILWNEELCSNIPSNLNIEKNIRISELQTDVQNSIAHLPSPQKEVIILKYLEGKSYDEISDILQIPTGTAGSLASRGKKLLKKFLQKTYDESQ